MWGPIFEIGDAAALAGEAPSTPTAACSKGSRRTSPLLLGDPGVDGFPRCTAGTRPARLRRRWRQCGGISCWAVGARRCPEPARVHTLVLGTRRNASEVHLCGSRYRYFIPSYGLQSCLLKSLIYFLIFFIYFFKRNITDEVEGSPFP